MPPHQRGSGRISAPFFFSPRKENDSGGFLSLFLYLPLSLSLCTVSMPEVSLHINLSGAKLDCAMRSLPRSKTCEVYCVSRNGHSQVSRLAPRRLPKTTTVIC